MNAYNATPPQTTNLVAGIFARGAVTGVPVTREYQNFAYELSTDRSFELFACALIDLNLRPSGILFLYLTDSLLFRVR